MRDPVDAGSAPTTRRDRPVPGAFSPLYAAQHSPWGLLASLLHPAQAAPATPAAAAEGDTTIPDEVLASSPGLPNLSHLFQGGVAAPSLTGMLAAVRAPYGPGGGITQAMDQFHQYANDAMDKANQAWGSVQQAMDEPVAQPTPAAEFATRLAGNLSQAIAPQLNGQQSAEAHISGQRGALQQRQLMRLQLLEKHADILAERAMRLGDTEQAQKLHMQAQKAAAEQEAMHQQAALKTQADSTTAQLRQQAASTAASLQLAQADKIFQINSHPESIANGTYAEVNPQTGAVEIKRRTIDTTAGRISNRDYVDRKTKIEGYLQTAIASRDRAKVGEAIDAMRGLEMQPRVGERPDQVWNRLQSVSYPVARGWWGSLPVANMFLQQGVTGEQKNVYGKPFKEAASGADKNELAESIARMFNMSDPQREAFFTRIKAPIRKE